MEHFYETIEGWFSGTDKKCYDDAVEKYKDDDVFVEIGSFKGRSSIAMAVNIINSGKKIKFYCVDTWQGSSEHQNNPDVVSGKLKKTFDNNIEPVNFVINAIQKPSTEAANLFENESLSFVFIDASHDYENVKKDIEAWLPKIKKGGTLAGHDWNYSDVRRAVKHCFKKSIKKIKTAHDYWQMDF